MHLMPNCEASSTEPCNARRVLRDTQAYTEIFSIISKFHPDATDYEF